MNPIFKDPVHIAEGITLRDLLTKPNELKLDYNTKITVLDDEDFNIEESDDEQDILGTIEELVDTSMLSSPEYHTFEQLSKKMTECVCPTGGVRILILEEGHGPLISLDAEVTYHYAAYWEGAKVPFDSTVSMNNGKPLTQRVGMGMLPGISIGFLSVRGPSARFLLLLEPQIAYMDSGIPPRIKPSQTVLFVLTLYDVRNTQAAVRFNDLPRETQAKYSVAMDAIKDIRAEGKHLFERKKYKKAIKSYEHAISIMRLTQPENDSEEEELKEVKVKIFLNLAVCYYKESMPKHVLVMCENIDRYIDIDRHCKALYYYALASEMLGKTNDAVTYYKKALKLEPKNKEIGKKLSELDSRNKKFEVDEKAMWQKAFNTEKKDDIVYDVEEDFKNTVIDMCQDLAGRNEYAKFDLPNGLTKTEIDCIKSLTGQFEGLIVTEDDVGKNNKKVSIIKKIIG